MTNKKGDIWVSAVLYFGLGIIIITILLTAGLPVINKLRDKNIAIQTKEAFHILDQNIREVLKGGPGTQRVVTLNIKKGQFKINDASVALDADKNTITWAYNSKIFLTEPSEINAPLIFVRDGNINVATAKSTTKGSYDITFKLSYNDIAAINPGAATRLITISGLGDISIRNGGPVQSPLDPTNPDKRIKLFIVEAGR